jgi:uncharacterized membrane-anchored protein
MSSVASVVSALAGLTPAELTGSAVAGLVLCWFIMVALKRTVGLPMEVSVLVVPVIVSVGFAAALAVRLYLDVPLLYAAAGLGAVMIPLSAAYERLFGSPG